MDKNVFNLLDNLIHQTIDDVKAQSDIAYRISRKLGDNFVEVHFSDLKKELLKEIKLEKQTEPMHYVSIREFFNKKYLGFNDSRKWVVSRKYASRPYRKGNKYLVNLVFPCRNSGKTVGSSLVFLISEISKTYNADFNVVFQINNNSDNTVVKISEILDLYKKILKNCNFFILETPQDKVISLPGSLNEGAIFLDRETSGLRGNYEQVFFSFWDDELYDLIPRPDSLFNSNMSVILSSITNKAISGYMIDNRTGISRWHDVSKGFSADIRFIHTKPYLHGGAGTLVRWEDFPREGIKLGGIADTDLSEYLLRKIDYKILKGLDHDDWPVRNNHHAPVFHPIEEDILKWTIKYLMYQISWENTYEALNKGKHKIGKLWKKRINENRSDFHHKISDYLVNLSPEKILDREFMHYYYLTLQKTGDKKAKYDQLKNYRLRSLEIS